jgi:hypothetical protein
MESAAAHAAGVDRGADAGHDAAAQQARDLGLGGRVDLGALPGVDEGLLDEGPDAQRGGELLAGLEGHLLGGVVGGEAVPGLTAAARATGAVHGAPVEDDVVAGCDVGDALTDRLHDAGGLVAEQERELVVDPAFPVVQVGVADPAGLDLDDGLAGTRIGDDDRLDRDRRALRQRDDPANLLRHGVHSRG